MILCKRLVVAASLFLSIPVHSQSLQPGFDKGELAEMLCISARTGSDPAYYSDTNYIAKPRQFHSIYRSPEMGLLNLWELWSDGSRVVLSIRGTIPNPDSWLANMYAAMVPASGYLILAPNDTFHYQLATHPKAAVHVGWLMGAAFLGRDMLPKIDSCYTAGIRDFYITGHSQGGAISYLVTAYLLRLKEKQRIPADVRFKTYCTAAPKPGNLYFAYDYELATEGGWAFNVVNETDWVPEVPISIQTLDDFNPINPFVLAKDLIRKQRFPKNLALRFVYNQLDKPTRRAQRRYEKYLGNLLSKEICKKIPGFKVNGYYHSNDYVRTGTTIVLQSDSAYYQRFPQLANRIFVNHLHHSYVFLTDKSLLDSSIQK